MFDQARPWHASAPSRISTVTHVISVLILYLAPLAFGKKLTVRSGRETSTES
jgi:hypothetical protein